MKLSARNQLSGAVVDVTPGAVTVVIKASDVILAVD